jgi:hypothetical protein
MRLENKGGAKDRHYYTDRPKSRNSTQYYYSVATNGNFEKWSTKSASFRALKGGFRTISFAF